MYFLKAIITNIITMFFLCAHFYCLAYKPPGRAGTVSVFISATAQTPDEHGPQVSIKQTNQLTDCSAETHCWLLFGKIWGSSMCQLVKVTEMPLDHSKETGILLLLKPIHVSDAFSVRDKCKLQESYYMQRR